MIVTIEEAPALGASDFSGRLERELEALSVAEAMAIVRDFLAYKADPPRRRATVRACRCARPWTFERGRCSKCGHDLRAGGMIADRAPSGGHLNILQASATAEEVPPVSAGECADCGEDLDRDLDPSDVCTACWRRRHDGWHPLGEL